jgi:uncharacterized protein YsxB (DUF464 family)
MGSLSACHDAGVVCSSFSVVVGALRTYMYVPKWIISYDMHVHRVQIKLPEFKGNHKEVHAFINI